ncbi:unnamed protein product [Ectocarpus sp. 13 AM-2016]
MARRYAASSLAAAGLASLPPCLVARPWWACGWRVCDLADDANRCVASALSKQVCLGKH